MGRKRFGLVAGMIGALVMVLVACSSNSGSDTGSGTTQTGSADTPLRLAIATPVQTLDLSRYQGQTDLVVGDLIFDPLVGYGADLKIVPRLAESWEQPNPTTYVFKLRSGVKFSDGTDLTGQDVKDQFDIDLTLPALKSWTEAIKSVTADGLTVTFTLSHPSPSFLSNVANGPFSIQSAASRKMDPKELATNPVGTGPYKLQSWKGDVITLVRNDQYWGTKPTQQTITFTTVQDTTTRLNGLESGQFDIMQNVDPYTFTKLGDYPDLVGLNVPYVQTAFLLFTQVNPILKDQKVREAIALALDVPSIVKSATEGLFTPATSFIPPALGTSTAKARTQDIAKAKQLLTEAGYPNGFEIPLYNTNGRYVGDNQMAQIIQNQLAQVGITAKITVYEYAALLNLFKKPETGLVVVGWTNRATPDAMLGAMFASDGGFNWAVYKNPDFDALLTKAGSMATAEEAFPLWAQADQLLIDDVAGVPLYWANSLYAYRKGITGFGVNPLGLVQVTTVERS